MIYATTVIFDLDGTLLNTLEDLADSVNYALQELGFPERSDNEIKSFIGNGVEQLIIRSVPENTSEEKIKECLAVFKIHYIHNSKNKTKPYKGIIELLTNLKKKGFKIGVVSNKFDKAVKKLCNEYFFGLIDSAIGESTNIKKKPSPDGVKKVMEELNADKDKTVMIGDSKIDMQTAKNAEIYSVGVLWGFDTEQNLIEAGAKELVDSPEKLNFIL